MVLLQPTVVVYHAGLPHVLIKIGMNLLLILKFLIPGHFQSQGKYYPIWIREVSNVTGRWRPKSDKQPLEVSSAALTNSVASSESIEKEDYPEFDADIAKWKKETVVDLSSPRPKRACTTNNNKNKPSAVDLRESSNDANANSADEDYDAENDAKNAMRVRRIEKEIRER